MKSLCKTLVPTDYADGNMGLWVYSFDAIIASLSIPYMPNPHLHRRWEYGMAMEFLRELGGPDVIKSVLDVGGAGSLFAPIALSMGYRVTVVDPDPCVMMFYGQMRNVSIEAQGEAICADFLNWGVTNEDGVYGVTSYDAVVSLSTIEHVPNDVDFIRKLAKHAEKGLFITTDFSMSGEVHNPGHLRTYTPKTMVNKLAGALPEEWKFAGEPEYIDYGPQVMDYNFASLGMVYEQV